jgi:methylated-DNA-protein-cysteine methyltransferase related protein
MHEDEFDEMTFAEKVMYVVSIIPEGKVTTYGAIASLCGARRSARTVGWILNASKNRTDMPFHRVVNRMGILSGKRFYPTPTMMQEFLEHEGVEVVEDCVDMKKKFWEPKIVFEKTNS